MTENSYTFVIININYWRFIRIMGTEIEILFAAATLGFLTDPFIWVLSILLAFLTKKYWFIIRLPVIWITLFFIATLILGEMESYKYSAASLAYLIISLVAIIIIKSDRTKKNYQHLTIRVGTVLHNQIYSALKENEEKAGMNLLDLKATGYISGFINYFIQDSKIEEKDHKDIYKIILNGVLPNRLEDIFTKNTARYELAKITEGLEYEVEEFKTGVKWGEYDASTSDYDKRPNSLISILLGKKPKVTISKNSEDGD